MFTPEEAREIIAAKVDATTHCNLIDTALRQHALLDGFIQHMNYNVGPSQALAQVLAAMYTTEGWSVNVFENGPDRAYESYNNYALKFALTKR